MKTKTQRILEYVRDNEPCKAKDICEAILEKRDLPGNQYGLKPYSYYVGWSGFRESLTKTYPFTWSNDTTKGRMRLTKNGYKLTAYGRRSLQ